MAEQKVIPVLLPTGSMAEIAKADFKRSPLPFTAVKGKYYPVTEAKLQAMAEGGNWKGLMNLRNISPDGKIYDKYLCVADTSNPQECIVIRLLGRDDFLIPKFEVATNASILEIQDKPANASIVP